jgi:predicted DsbA family dithiol-disulfide isomerase
MGETRTVLVEVYADVVCPWCYIGKKRLESALALRPGLSVERRWRPFQLQPDLPREGVTWREFAQQKFGGWERAQSMFAHVAQTGAADGIDFNFDRVASAPNTLDAHRLILFAAEHNREWEMVDALFAAYFKEGRNLNDLSHLAEIAAQVGLDARQVSDYLAGSANEDAVNASQETAYELGIHGVPFYIFDNRYALSGAQPVKAFLYALDKASEQARTA